MNTNMGASVPPAMPGPGHLADPVQLPRSGVPVAATLKWSVSASRILR